MKTPFFASLASLWCADTTQKNCGSLLGRGSPHGSPFSPLYELRTPERILHNEQQHTAWRQQHTARRQ